jgi:uncharacterized protein YggE
MNKNLITSTLAVVGIVFVALVLIDFFHISYPITITSTNRSSELSVVGEGKVDVVPDTAHVNLGISVTNGATVAEVQQTLNQTNNAIVEAMKKLGIQKTDIQTRDYTISPNLDYSVNPPKQTGFSGSVNIVIKVKNPQLASQAIDAATQAGANQINGTQFTVENPEKYREQAREKAIENAKEQAQKLARNLGIHLGKITNIVESSGYDGGPIPMMAKSAGLGMGGADSANIEPGSQTISSVVTLYFEKN